MINKKASQLQIKYIRKFLDGCFGHYHHISNESVQIILAFVFSSPFRQKGIFVLKQGSLLLQFNKKSYDNTQQSDFVISNKNQQIITQKRPFILRQNDHFMIGNEFNQNQRIRISNIWLKPATRTQKKILTYCGRFKQFLMGKHHQRKTIDLRYLNREFLIPSFERDQFDRNMRNVEINDANFCSFDVLDSYMALVTKNYIQIQVQQNQYNDNYRKVYKVLPEGLDLEIFNGIRLIFIEKENRWQFKGQNLVIWVEQNIITRKQQLIRTLDGKVDLVEGNRIQNVQEFQFLKDE